jgi:hypothetical protein
MILPCGEMIDCVSKCLENAILDHDVAGFAAGTTPRQRSRIRSYLGVKVRPDDLESFASEPPPQLNRGAAVLKTWRDVVGGGLDLFGGVSDGYAAPGPLQHFNVVVAVTNG